MGSWWLCWGPGVFAGFLGAMLGFCGLCWGPGGFAGVLGALLGSWGLFWGPGVSVEDLGALLASWEQQRAKHLQDLLLKYSVILNHKYRENRLHCKLFSIPSCIQETLQKSITFFAIASAKGAGQSRRRLPRPACRGRDGIFGTDFSSPGFPPAPFSETVL